MYLVQLAESDKDSPRQSLQVMHGVLRSEGPPNILRFPRRLANVYSSLPPEGVARCCGSEVKLYEFSRLLCLEGEDAHLKKKLLPSLMSQIAWAAPAKHLVPQRRPLRPVLKLFAKFLEVGDATRINVDRSWAFHHARLP